MSENEDKCSLCELKTRIRTYDESDPRWIIIDCMNCVLPMIVWRGNPKHTMEISKKDYEEMEKALRKVADEQFEGQKYKIDKVQREIPDHLHWHARPEGWVFPEHRKNIAEVKGGLVWPLNSEVLAKKS